jgi:hypothetical protein
MTTPVLSPQTAEPMVRHITKHPVLRGCVNLYTLAQTANAAVPSMGPHPRDYAEVPMHMVVPTLRPPLFQHRSKLHMQHGHI